MLIFVYYVYDISISGREEPPKTIYKNIEKTQGTFPLAPPTSAMMGYTCSMHSAMMLGRKGLNTWPGS